MSPPRRSVRSKRTLDYSKLGENDQSDDDFATDTPPPSKKRTKKSNNAACIIKSSDRNNCESSCRLPARQSKKYEDELSLALKLSLEASKSKTGGDGDFKEVITKAQVCTIQTKCNEKEDDSAISRSRFRSKEGGVVCDVQDKIVEAPTNRGNHGGRKNGADEEYVASPENSSDEEFEEDLDDVDFNEEESKNKRRNKNNFAVKKSEKTETAKKSSNVCKKGNATSQSRKQNIPPVGLKTTFKSKSSPLEKQTSSCRSKVLRAINSDVTFRQPCWTPPGIPGKPSHPKAGISSPVSLRLGLSRNVRLKPLHPSLKIN